MAELSLLPAARTVRRGCHSQGKQLSQGSDPGPTPGTCAGPASSGRAGSSARHQSLSHTGGGHSRVLGVKQEGLLWPCGSAQASHDAIAFSPLKIPSSCWTVGRPRSHSQHGLVPSPSPCQNQGESHSEVVESPSREGFKRGVDVEHGDMV